MLSVKNCFQSAVLAALMLTLPTQAATFNVANGDVAGLKSAINTANANNVADTINLAANGTYNLTTVDNNNFGANGLPIIIDDLAGADLTINGNGATLRRNPTGSLPAFRLMPIGEVTNVTIKDLTFFGGKVLGDEAIGAGGAILTAGSLTLDNCRFGENDAQDAGGAIGMDGGTLTMTDCVFEGNEVTGGFDNSDGGAIAVSSSTVNATNCTFTENVAQNGGAFHADGSDGPTTTTFTNCTFEFNSALGIYGGGALYNDGDGQYNTTRQATMTLNNCTLDGNNADRLGGGIINDGADSGSASLTLNNCVLKNNQANDGGALMNVTEIGAATAMATLNNCTLSNNSADFGGGISNFSSSGSVALTLTGCTLNANTSVEAGGGIESYAAGANSSATITARNCTFSANSATGPSDPAPNGGGLKSGSENGATASATITNCTFVENSASVGANLYNDNDPGGETTMRVGSCLFQGTSGVINDGGTFISQGYNLSSDNGGGVLTAATDKINTNPQLGPLADNGGPTLTHALLGGSPALDKGKDLSGTGKDQRGLTRPFDQPGIAIATGGDGSDIGAYEAQALPPSLSINNVSVSEGNSGTSSATFTVSLSRAATQPVTVQYATSNETATAGSDYTAKTGTVTIPAGQTSGAITISVLGDTLVESNETFNVTLSNATNAVIGGNTGTGTIVNDDTAPAPSLSINNVSISEGNTGTTLLSFTVSLSQAFTQTVTVQYATANGSGVAGSDYTAQTGTVTIPAGQTTGTITVPVIGDTVAESNDTLFVNLSNPTNATLSDSQGVGTILNDDTGPSLSINDVTITEGNSNTVNATFTVTLSAASNQTVTVSAITSNGSARSPGDYTATGVRLTFAPGETSKTVSVPVKGDLLDEVNETFFVVLSSSNNAILARGRGIGTINDDDAAPTVSIDDISIGEGNSGQRSATLRLRLSALSGQSVRVSYATASGTTNPATAGNDYVAVAPTVVAFNAGSTVAYARVLINGDVLTEANETFLVNLSSPVNATIADGQATGTILNDDTAPAFSINDVSITEGNAGTKQLAFTVTLSKASGQSISVNYATANGTAQAGSDYIAKNGTLTFAPGGALTQTVSIIINGDTVVESNEALYVLLSGAVNASISKARGVGTITNDDTSG